MRNIRTHIARSTRRYRPIVWSAVVTRLASPLPGKSSSQGAATRWKRVETSRLLVRVQGFPPNAPVSAVPSKH